MADDHQRLIDQVFGYVRDQLAHGGLEFTVLTINENGHRNRLRIDPRFMESGAAKDVLTDGLRQEFREQGIVLLCADCRMLDGPQVAGRGSRLPVKAWTNGWLNMPGSMSGGACHRIATAAERDEIILMHVCDRKRSTFRFWGRSIRDPITGEVRDLIRFRRCRFRGRVRRALRINLFGGGGEPRPHDRKAGAGRRCSSPPPCFPRRCLPGRAARDNLASPLLEDRDRKSWTRIWQVLNHNAWPILRQRDG